MVDFYVLEIKLGHITIDQVNKFWRAKVQAKLDEMDDSEQVVVMKWTIRCPKDGFPARVLKEGSPVIGEAIIEKAIIK